MNKQQIFDKLFLEKNQKIDKEIEKERTSALFSNKMLKLYEHINDIPHFQIANKAAYFYQAESDRYVFTIYQKGTWHKFHNFQIYFKDQTCNYELEYIRYNTYTPYDAIKNLPTNEMKIQYTKEKLDFLAWSRKYKDKLYQNLISPKGIEITPEIINPIDIEINILKNL